MNISPIDDKNTKFDIHSHVCCDESMGNILKTYIEYFSVPLQNKQILHVEIHPGVRISWDCMFKIYMAIQYKCSSINTQIESLVFYIHNKFVVNCINRLVDLFNPTIPLSLIHI